MSIMMSESINELMAALAKAQGQMQGAVKDSSNPHFKSRYADLASVWAACREPLASNGLAIVQTVSNDENSQYLTTLLGHSSGQWMKSIIKLPVQKAGAQELGSCLSYCRRYGLASMVGVYQDDDDGERSERRPEPKKEYAKISETQCAQLDAWILEFPEGNEWLMKTYNLHSAYDLTQEKWAYVEKIFLAKKQKSNTDHPLEPK